MLVTMLAAFTCFVGWTSDCCHRSYTGRLSNVLVNIDRHLSLRLARTAYNEISKCKPIRGKVVSCPEEKHSCTVALTFYTVLLSRNMIQQAVSQ